MLGSPIAFTLRQKKKVLSRNKVRQNRIVDHHFSIFHHRLIDLGIGDPPLMDISSLTKVPSSRRSSNEKSPLAGPGSHLGSFHVQETAWAPEGWHLFGFPADFHGKVLQEIQLAGGWTTSLKNMKISFATLRMNAGDLLLRGPGILAPLTICLSYARSKHGALRTQPSHEAHSPTLSLKDSEET